jgi:Tripartite tricarboxylate transporter TctB family
VRLSGALAFSAGLALVAAYAVYAALKWPSKAALFPLTMGIPLLVLALVQVVQELRAQPRRAEQGLANRRSLAVFAWMGAFIALVLLLGFPVAVPVFVFSYLTVASREGWVLSGALAAAAWAAFHLLFQRLLHFPFETGLITGWFQ